MTKEEALKGCTVEGNNIKLPAVQLDRKIYAQLKKDLELIGGKRKGGKIFAFVFDSDPTEKLQQLIIGEYEDPKKKFQFFETPADIADYLVSLADLKEEHIVLEPSAGQGAIVKAINRQFPAMEVLVCELMPLNFDVLKAMNTVNTLGNDYLQASLKPAITIDRIIANPPFTKNQDIQHVMKMYHDLKQGGRLVSIMSPHWTFANDKQSVAFRDWIAGIGGTVEHLNTGAFKESGTNVKTVIVIINKN